jgi:hypothetical protein
VFATSHWQQASDLADGEIAIAASRVDPGPLDVRVIVEPVDVAGPADPRARPPQRWRRLIGRP